ncbi:hypothetical protein GCM10025298_03650 [Natronobiforma cellulositropha]
MFVVGVSALVATCILHLAYLPRYFPDERLTVSAVLVLGWATYTVGWYAIGRLFSDPGPVPSLRSLDVGVALFLCSLLLGLGLDTLGFTPELVLEAYALPAVGIYVGLALVGWSIGVRTNAINRFAHDE